tara:strand:- start:161 stop:310 length:150 start_codon:yes stop_codon:yes gene_type:complete
MISALMMPASGYKTLSRFEISNFRLPTCVNRAFLAIALFGYQVLGESIP